MTFLKGDVLSFLISLASTSYLSCGRCLEEMLLLGRVDYIRLQDLTQLLIQFLHLKTKLANVKLSSNSVCDIARYLDNNVNNASMAKTGLADQVRCQEETCFGQLS